jgi:SAM-dependent methyltransferase
MADMLLCIPIEPMIVRKRSKLMWDTRYSQPGYAFGTEPNDFLCSVADRIPMGAVLCLGDGEGRNGVFLAERGFAVTSMDGSTIGMQKAAMLAQARSVPLTTTVADLVHYQIMPAAWEGIVSIFVHLPPPLRHQVHRQVAAGLKPGGVFILEAYTPAQLTYGTGGPSSAELLMTLDQLRVDLAGLAFEVAHEIERDVVEGRYHTGRAAVIQLLARKA